MCLVINGYRVEGTSYKLAPAGVLKVMCLVINGYRVKGTSYKLAPAGVEILERPMSLEGYVFSN